MNENVLHDTPLLETVKLQNSGEHDRITIAIHQELQLTAELETLQHT
jgi:hypothetical protein